MNTEPTGLLTVCRAAEASFHAFFTGESPASGTFADRLGAVLSAIELDCEHGHSSSKAVRTRITKPLHRLPPDDPAHHGTAGFVTLFEAPPDGTTDSVDALNLLAAVCTGFPFSRLLDKMLFERLAALTPHGATPAAYESDSDAAFFYRHAVRLAESLKDLIPAYCALLAERSGEAPEGAVSRLRPSVFKLESAQSAFLRMKPGAVALEVARMSSDDPFAHGRVFRHQDGVFVPLTLPSIRSADEFYGYASVRRMFQEHFRAFSEGRNNLPLLISSLPGLGKTQMSIAYSLSFPNITLIIPQPGDLTAGLEPLIAELAPWTEHKFMLFFDDIDAVKTDWYYFRTNIGGTFSLPENITVTIASNQRFPANISSRGRGCEFPMFDEIRCQEMILDFLSAKGLKAPSKNLVAVIASDYVSEFGQKQFEELSPRTLVRYLDHYLSDPAKRKTLMDESNSEVVQQPDPQVFYEENVKLMRSIHGEDALNEFREDAVHVK